MVDLSILSLNELLIKQIQQLLLILRRLLFLGPKSTYRSVCSVWICFGNQFNVKLAVELLNLWISNGGIEGEVYLTDIPRSNNLIGDIAVFKPAVSATEDPVVVVGSAGIVDYMKGEVILNTIKISSTVKDNNIVEIQAFPESNDIIGLKDIYLNLDISNTEINIVRDTISSGQQISGIGYKVTSSYSNGSLIRQ